MTQPKCKKKTPVQEEVWAKYKKSEQTVEAGIVAVRSQTKM